MQKWAAEYRLHWDPAEPSDTTTMYQTFVAETQAEAESLARRRCNDMQAEANELDGMGAPSYELVKVTTVRMVFNVDWMAPQ